MQSRGGASRAPVRYARPESEEPPPPARVSEDEVEEDLLAAVSPVPPTAHRQPAKEDPLIKACLGALQSAAASAKQHSGLLAAAAGALTAAAALGVLLQRRKGGDSSRAGPGPCAKLRPTPSCVPLADGSGVVVRRPIPADNSCLFNAVGHLMHHSTNRAPHLRDVVAREVAGDPLTWSDVFLGMPNAQYCSWILNPVNWGGGIELAILAAHYKREIAAWNIETGKMHVFGEEQDYKRRIMVIYNGVHYDALALAANPRAGPEDDVTEFQPRTKRGKMILAAAKKLVQLNQLGDKFVSPNNKKKGSKEEQQQQQQQQQKAAESQQSAGSAAAAAGGTNDTISSGALQCQDCSTVCGSTQAARQHAADTGHTHFTELEPAEAIEGAARSSKPRDTNSSSSSGQVGGKAGGRTTRPRARKVPQQPAPQLEEQQQQPLAVAAS